MTHIYSYISITLKTIILILQHFNIIYVVDIYVRLKYMAQGTHSTVPLGYPVYQLHANV